MKNRTALEVSNDYMYVWETLTPLALNLLNVCVCVGMSVKSLTIHFVKVLL